MSKEQPTEVQQWMFDQQWDLGPPILDTTGSKPKCGFCRHYLVDDIAYIARDEDGFVYYCCIECADSRYHGDERLNIKPAPADTKRKGPIAVSPSFTSTPEYFDSTEEMEASMLAQRIRRAVETLRSPDWDHPSEVVVRTVLDAVIDTCKSIHETSDVRWHKRLIEEGQQFLAMLERTLWKLPEERTMPFYIALLGAGMESAPGISGFGAIVSDAMHAILKMDRKRTMPSLLEEIPPGIKEFGEYGWDQEEPLPWRSWNAAFLLAKMSKLDETPRADPATIDLLCLIMTYDPAGSNLHNDHFEYADDAATALSCLPEDDVVAALGRALNNRCSYRREHVAKVIAEYAERGNELALTILLEMCRTEWVDGPDMALSIVLDSRLWANRPEVFERVVRAVGNNDDNFGRLIDEATALETLAVALRVLDHEQQNSRIPESVKPTSDLAVKLFTHPEAAVRTAFVRLLKENQDDSGNSWWADETIDALRIHNDAAIREAVIDAFGVGEVDEETDG
jgi:hypothetical protein